MNDHITKPLDPDELLQALTRWIRRSPAASSVAEGKRNRSPDKTVELAVELPGIDVRSALKRVGGDLSLYQKLWKQFESDYKDLYSDISRLNLAGDYASLQALGHSLKGVCGNLGIVGVGETAAKLEQIESTGTKELADLQQILKEQLNEAQISLGNLSELVGKTESPDQQTSSKQLITLIDELIPLLREGDIDSLSYVDSIEGCKSEAYEDLLNALINKISEYDFDQALVIAEDLHGVLSNY